MRVYAQDSVAFPALDIIVGAWTAEPKRFPFNNTDAVVPQRLIPDELQKDTFELTCFYFYVCLYMKGRIKSDLAFKALLRMREDIPELFDPLTAQFMSKERVEAALRKYVNRDIVQTAKAWRANSRELMQNWGGDPRNITKGLKTYNEALRRIRNKRNVKSALAKSLRKNGTGHGFEGFQPKMVSMLIYFLDWEGLLETRFPYPAPADFHNFRFGLATGSLIVETNQIWFRFSEKLSKPWRDMCMRYLKARSYDPIDVADALWLFSALMCGRSPLTTMVEPREENYDRTLFRYKGVHEKLPLIRPDFMNRKSPGFVKRLSATCLACPFLQQCKYAIPATPYYQNKVGADGVRYGGRIYLIPRPPIERRFPVVNPEQESVEAPVHPTLFSLDSKQ